MRLFILSLCALALAACGQSPATHDEPGFIRLPASGAQMSAAYLTVASDVDDRLVSAAVAGVKRTEIHTVINENGVMKMRPLTEGVEIAAGEKVVFEPGGMHLMLIGFDEAFSEGETRDVTLRFESGREETVALEVSRNGTSGHQH